MLARIDNYKKGEDRAFKVGLYLRLSREDDNYSLSESIVNQKNYLTDYVLEKGWTLVDTYVDDGYTGTNFDRPGFNRLLRDIEDKKINLVITKDLSRLGRDYIKTGYYLEQYFPDRGVRYIAVNDGIDTFADNNSNNDMSPFKSVMNDMYAKDISKKVRTTLDSKRANGKFVGAFAPYGYMKSLQDKNKLVIDPETAPIIRQIFELYVKGYGYTKIANILNDEGILPPGLYKYKNSNYKNPKSKHCLWTPETVSKILLNPTYAGNLAQSKYRKINYKLKKLRTVPRQEWVVVENTHEPIVDIDTFRLVQEMMRKKVAVNSLSSQTEHLLSGFIFCGDCGERMTFTATKKGNVYVICSKYKRLKRCTRHSFLESELEFHILNELRKIVAFSIDCEKLVKAASSKAVKTKKNDILSEIDRNEKRLKEIKRAIKSLYEDKLKGVLTEEDFVELSREYGKEREKLLERLSQLNAKIVSDTETESEKEALIKQVKDFIGFKEPNRAILSKLIEKIEIFENKRVAVYYKFKKPEEMR
ncbi:MAG TPA: recombinase family protein [Acetivibrio sp.]|mgnify:CR=1 FL=1|uniref:recombinase family protein n=1 Tax=Acetivibrio sp. TaxID=1872092 RepID=UPI002B9EA71B|nr:recombinase family protein [Acetivibrio sp.]HOM01552.1 recombinase family protein [Acetivibrio sp.]